jgi:hypothetical protein
VYYKCQQGTPKIEYQQEDSAPRQQMSSRVADSIILLAQMAQEAFRVAGFIVLVDFHVAQWYGVVRKEEKATVQHAVASHLWR